MVRASFIDLTFILQYTLSLMLSNGLALSISLSARLRVGHEHQYRSSVLSNRGWHAGATAIPYSILAWPNTLIYNRSMLEQIHVHTFTYAYFHHEYALHISKSTRARVRVPQIVSMADFYSRQIINYRSGRA